MAITVNVMDYGAFQDGVSDSLPAFKSANIAAAAGGPGSSIYVPGIETLGADNKALPYLFKGTSTSLRVALALSDGVSLTGDGYRLSRIGSHPESPDVKLIGESLSESATGVHGGISISRVGLWNHTFTNDDQAHCIVFGSASKVAEVADISISDVVIEGSAFGDGIYFGNNTRDIELDWVEVLTCGRKAFCFSSTGINRKNITIRNCIATGVAIGSSTLHFEVESPINENEELDGRLKNVLIENCYLNGSVALGKMRHAIFRNNIVHGPLVAGSPIDLLIEDTNIHWYTKDFPAPALSGSSGKRGIRLYGTGRDNVIKNVSINQHGPFEAIRIAGVTNTTLQGSRIELDESKPPVVGISLGDTIVTTHPAGS